MKDLDYYKRGKSKKGEETVMNTSEIVAKSVSVLRSYYQNDIQPFIDAMHPDIYWYGPCEGQIIHTKETLEKAFMQEQNGLTFELYDLKSELLWKDKDSCEVVITFLVDTYYPDQKVIRCDQRVLLSWRQVWQKDAEGRKYQVPMIRTCFIANAIPMDLRDTIYPVHFTETPLAEKFSVNPSIKHVTFKGKDSSLLYLAENEIVFVRSIGHYTQIHCLHDNFESSEGITAIHNKYPELFVRVHKSYLLNPWLVKSMKRFEAAMVDGSRVPISTRKYMEIKKNISENV